VDDSVALHAGIEAVLEVTVDIDHDRDGLEETESLVDVDAIVYI